MRSDGHRYGKNGGHGNRDSSDKEHEKIIDSRPILTILDREHYDNLDHHSDGNRTNAEIPNCRQDLKR